jgi:hypothetical protein
MTVRVTDFVARLRGKRWAYDTPEEVAELLEGQRESIRGERLPVHMNGAATLSSQLAYQPGLADLAGEAYESALYLEALLTTARAAGYDELADALQEAAAVQHEAVAVLAEATHATVPAPQIPLTQAA